MDQVGKIRAMAARAEERVEQSKRRVAMRLRLAGECGEVHQYASQIYWLESARREERAADAAAGEAKAYTLVADMLAMNEEIEEEATCP